MENSTLNEIIKNIEQNEDLQGVEQEINSHAYLLVMLFGSIVTCFSLLLYSFKLCKQYEAEGYIRSCLESPTSATEDDNSVEIELSGVVDTKGEF